MQLIALLPMKSHSERVPNKNIREFAGKPLYHHVAGVLEISPLIERIIINTDSGFIADDAVRHFSKAVIHERPPELCGDFVSMNRIIKWDIDHTDGAHFLQTHSTNPLLTRETLERAVQTYFDHLTDYDSLFSVTPYQGRFYRADGSPVNHNPDELIRTQDLPVLFEENSNMFIFSRQSFAQAGDKRIGQKPFLFPMNKLEAVDIDDAEDWRLAEAVFGLRSRE